MSICGSTTYLVWKTKHEYFGAMDTGFGLFGLEFRFVVVESFVVMRDLFRRVGFGLFSFLSRGDSSVCEEFLFPLFVFPLLVLTNTIFCVSCGTFAVSASCTKLASVVFGLFASSLAFGVDMCIILFFSCFNCFLIFFCFTCSWQKKRFGHRCPFTHTHTHIQTSISICFSSQNPNTS